MKSKWPLFLGIVLLTLGIILKSISIEQPFPLISILTGVAFKIYYIVLQVLKGAYKPGFEVILLLVGLTLFLTALSFKKHENDFNYLWLMIPGIALKVSFVVAFIIKSRQSK